MHKTIFAAALAGVYLLPAVASAQNVSHAGVPVESASVGKDTVLIAQSAPHKDIHEDVEPGIEFGGHVDTIYTNLSGAGKFTSGVRNRVFDYKRDALVLDAIDLSWHKLPENGFGGKLNLTLGKDADTIAAYGTIDKGRGPQNGANNVADVTQAFLHYGAGPFSVIAGKYVTMAGAEVIKGPANPNVSRSILFGYAIPFTHTGARATYVFSDALSVMVGVNEGWDTFKDTNDDLTAELGLLWVPSKMFSLAAQAYSGKEQLFNYPTISSNKGTRNLIDLVGTINATDRLSFTLNYDYGTQDNASTVVPSGASKAKWTGLAGYANYQFNDQWKLSFRAEYFDDKDGYRTGVVQKWKEATLTMAYVPPAVKNLELRAELRGDRSNVASFLAKDEATAKKSQNSFGLQALYKF